MKKTNAFFWYGVAVACLFTIVITQTGAVEALAKSAALMSLPRELQLGLELGILTPKEVDSNRLDTPISQRSYADKLRTTLFSIGLNYVRSSGDLVNTGIFTNFTAKAISRKDALESLARTVIHLAQRGIIKLEEDAKVSFSDYQPATKYQAAFQWLKDNNIVQGYPDGTIRGKRSLTTREAVYLLCRIHQQFGGQDHALQCEPYLMFTDLPLDDPVLPALKELANAGALTYMGLRGNFNGNAPVAQRDVMIMLRGILEKQGVANVKILCDSSNKSLAQRQQMAMALASFFKHLPDNNQIEENHRPVKFTDVKPDSSLASELAYLASKNLVLGYPNGRFAPSENVTWYEWLGAAKAALERANLVPQEVKQQKYASREDFQRFAAILQAKRLRVRQILNREIVQD